MGSMLSRMMSFASTTWNNGINLSLGDTGGPNSLAQAVARSGFARLNAYARASLSASLSSGELEVNRLIAEAARGCISRGHQRLLSPDHHDQHLAGSGAHQNLREAAEIDIESIYDGFVTLSGITFVMNDRANLPIYPPGYMSRMPDADVLRWGIKHGMGGHSLEAIRDQLGAVSRNIGGNDITNRDLLEATWEIEDISEILMRERSNSISWKRF